MNQPATPYDVLAFYAAVVLWIPLLAAAVHAPVLMTRWVNARNNDNPRFQLLAIQGYVPKKGCYLSMEVDPRQWVGSEKILAQARQICMSTAACAAISVVVLLTGWLIMRQAWMFASACAFAALLGWEIYPRGAGIRYRTGLLKQECLVRSLCLCALREALQGQTPIREWRPEYFEIVCAPADGSIEEYLAASWIHTRALLNDDLETATRYIERHLALLPENAPAEQYIGLGKALYFYTVVAPDETKSKLLAQRIQAISWDLPIRVEYIEAAIALAEGRPADARSIASGQLQRIGPEGGAAWIQLQRELLIRCRDMASSD